MCITIIYDVYSIWYNTCHKYNVIYQNQHSLSCLLITPSNLYLMLQMLNPACISFTYLLYGQFNWWKVKIVINISRWLQYLLHSYKLVIINPGLVRWAPLNQLILSKPQRNLPLSIFWAVAAMNNIPPWTHPKVSPDSSRPRVFRVGGPKHLASCSYNIMTLPTHGNHRPRLYILHQTREKWSFLQWSKVN